MAISELALLHVDGAEICRGKLEDMSYYLSKIIIIKEMKRKKEKDGSCKIAVKSQSINSKYPEMPRQDNE
jgi:hypothetical protein